MANILIIEDEVLVVKDLRFRLQELGHEIIESFPSAKGVLQSIKAEIPDVILMDINIQGEIDGVDLAELILVKHDIPIIFLTNESHELPRAIKLRPHNFIPKPLNTIAIKAAIQLATIDPEPKSENQNEGWVVFGNQSGSTRYSYDEIIYAKANSQYTEIFTTLKKNPLVQSKTLSQVESQLPPAHFLRVHRSFLVNKSFIRGWEGNELKMKEDIPDQIKIGPSYRVEIKKMLGSI